MTPSWCGVVLTAMVLVLTRPSWAAESSGLCSVIGRLFMADPGFQDNVRMCFKCLGRDACLEPKYATVQICSPDVHRCVTKLTVSKVTGASVSEQYCGSPEVLEDSLQVLEDKCYSNDISWDSRRTQTTFCYCSYDLCNVSSHLRAPSWSFLVALGVLAMLSTTVISEHFS
ncbi:uncharacterized protein LOC119585709 isoform X2 [Penaeus monodon]|uniref:uncharacterized protein LOC119585709 isoform X2 n=1 Tax=Penaeus monodon TaxID=6687 RepID=UPI0018A77B43|nr:uncharacterized protein LOC119585709 isoform X2 [Penaeus monodon]